MQEKLERLVGSVQRVTFHNAQNGFTVLELRTPGETVTVVGVMPQVTPGEELEVMGSGYPAVSHLRRHQGHRPGHGTAAGGQIWGGHPADSGERTRASAGD